MAETFFNIVNTQDSPKKRSARKIQPGRAIYRYRAHKQATSGWLKILRNFFAYFLYFGAGNRVARACGTFRRRCPQTYPQNM